MITDGMVYHGIQALIVAGVLAAGVYAVRARRYIDRLKREDDERARASRSPSREVRR